MICGDIALLSTPPQRLELDLDKLVQAARVHCAEDNLAMNSSKAKIMHLYKINGLQIVNSGW